MQHIYKAAALAKIKRGTETKHMCNHPVDLIKYQNNRFLTQLPKHGSSSPTIVSSNTLHVSDSDSKPIEVGESPKQKPVAQNEQLEIFKNKDHTSSKASSSPESSASVAEKIILFQELMANESSPSASSNVDMGAEDQGEVTTPLMGRREALEAKADLLAMFAEMDRHLEATTPPPPHGEPQMAPELNDLSEPDRPVMSQSSKLRGGSVTTTRPPSNRGSQVFGPSTLIHAHPAPSSAVNRSAGRLSEVLDSESCLPIEHPGFDQVAVTHHPLAEHPVQAFTPIEEGFAYPLPSTYAHAYQRRSPSFVGVTKPSSSKDEDTEETSNSYTAGLQRLHKAANESSFRNSQSGASPASRTNGNCEAASAKLSTPPKPLGEIDNPLSLPSPTSSNKSRIGASVGLYDQAILKLMDATPLDIRTTPPRPGSFSPISPEGPSPGPRKRAKRAKAAVQEDPFENWNSGSEKSDGDGAYEEVKDDEAKATKSSKLRGNDTGKAKAKARKTRNRVREEKSGALAVAEHTTRAVKRSRQSVGGYWPTADTAVRNVAHGQGVMGFGTTTTALMGGGEHVYPNSWRDEGLGRLVVEEPLEANEAVAGVQQQVRSSGRDGSGWTLVAEKVGGKRKVCWKLL
ncbi:MAG: hypothetical protein L6R39_001855 [Caloplaca ligustica]|nr:MAG: hypothetical protein L6R39_001855 [Caloplaca ligustica]